MAKNKDNLQEIQLLENAIQNIFMQKQAFQMELNETQSASKELENSGDDVFKIIGQLMVKTNKLKIKEELLSKEKFLNIKLKNFEKQEQSLMEKLNILRGELLGK